MLKRWIARTLDDSWREPITYRRMEMRDGVLVTVATGNLTRSA